MDQTPTIDRRTFLTAGGATALTTLAGCAARGLPFGRAEYTEPTEQSFGASEVATLAVDNGVGDVVVESGTTDRVEVRVVARAEDQAALRDVDVSVTLDEGALHVRTTVPPRRVTEADGTPRADVRVTLPSPGPVVESLTTRAGAVTLRDARGDATLHADVGSVQAARVDGFLTLSSGVGRVEATDVTGIDRAVTGMGEVEVTVGALRGDTEIGTDWGRAVVSVAEGLDLDVVADASGSLDCDLPLAERRRQRGRLTGRLNDGGHRLHVFSEFGDVSVRRLDA